MSTWKKLLEAAMEDRGETLADIEASTLTESGMLKEFDSGYGEPKGEPFTVWTSRSVYFPVCYDGFESVSWVSRHPDGQPTLHI